MFIEKNYRIKTGQELKDYLILNRLENKITLKDFAEKLGVTYPTLKTKLESPQDFTLTEMVKVSAILNTEITDILLTKKL